jgi:DNA-binding transcriptional regulator LsrR (DeoR family)
MRKVDENAFMYRIANMYYRDGISQSEIAQTEK